MGDAKRKRDLAALAREGKPRREQELARATSVEEKARSEVEVEQDRQIAIGLRPELGWASGGAILGSMVAGVGFFVALATREPLVFAGWQEFSRVLGEIDQDHAGLAEFFGSVNEHRGLAHFVDG